MTFDVGGRTVRAPVPDGWEAELVDGRLRIARGALDELPRPTVDIGFRAAGDVRALLDDEIGDLVLRLTDFTILHLEPRPPHEPNWSVDPPPLPFVLGGYRMGVFSMLMELGVAGSDGTDAALVSSVCLLEDVAGVQHEFDAILGGIEIEWR
jgi:hypothetical protein